MSEDAQKEMVSRRGFLGMGSVALAATGMLSAVDALAQDQTPYPTRNDRSTSAPSPGNLPLEAQNPDSFLPPPSDAGGVQTCKYRLALADEWMEEGGGPREGAVRELAVSKSIAGVDMRLTAG